MNIAEIINSIANHIDPTTGELFDESLLTEDDVHEAIKALRKSVSRAYHKESGKPASKNLLNRPSNIIFEELRQWRLETAKSIGLPAYMIFSDTDLWSISEGDVMSKEDLLHVKGIGQKSYELYGDDVYDVLKPYIKHCNNTEN